MEEVAFFVDSEERVDEVTFPVDSEERVHDSGSTPRAFSRR